MFFHPSSANNCRTAERRAHLSVSTPHVELECSNEKISYRSCRRRRRIIWWLRRQRGGQRGEGKNHKWCFTNHRHEFATSPSSWALPDAPALGPRLWLSPPIHQQLRLLSTAPSLPWRPDHEARLWRRRMASSPSWASLVICPHRPSKSPQRCGLFTGVRQRGSSVIADS